MFDLVSTLIAAGSKPSIATYAFTANHDDSSVSAINISNPASMTFVSELADATYLVNAKSIAVDRAARVAWVWATSYITAVNISNPASMSRLGSYSIGAFSSGAGHALALDTDNALVVAFDMANPQKVIFLNTGNPASITLAGSVSVSGYYGTNFGIALDTANRVAYCLMHDLTSVIRVVAVSYSNPASPSVVGTLNLTGSDITSGGLAYRNGLVYVSYGAGDFAVVNASSPASMSLSYNYTALFTLGGNGRVSHLGSDLVLVCAGTDDAMKTLDVSNIASVTVSDTESGATYLDGAAGHAIDPYNGNIFVVGPNGDDLTAYSRSGGAMTFISNYTSATNVNGCRDVALL